MTFSLPLLSSSSTATPPMHSNNAIFRRIVNVMVSAAVVFVVVTLLNRTSNGGGGGRGGNREGSHRDGGDGRPSRKTSSSAKKKAAPVLVATGASSEKSRGVVPMERSSGSALSVTELPYIRCGPIYTANSVLSSAQHRNRILGQEDEAKDEEEEEEDEASTAPAGELVLLHGARFTKETWDETSGILDLLCKETGALSVVALDLPVAAQGNDLPQALQALQTAELLSGEPVVVVTPSASGKAVLSMLQEEKVWLRGWIPVAAGAVQEAESATLQRLGESMPILAIYGNEDVGGKKTTLRLVDEAQATSLELKGKHPCYLDSPHEFVAAVVDFVQKQYQP